MTTSAQFPSGPGNPLTGTANVQTTNYQVLATDAGTWIVINSSGSVNVTLPATPPDAHFTIGVISIGTGTTTVVRNGHNINGVAANITLIQNQGVLLSTDGTDWYCIECAVSLVLQSGNVVLASPSDGSSGTPTFRTLVAADIPNLAASKITTGTLALARGGTNADLSASGGAHSFLAEDASHVVTARTITLADSPSVGDVAVVMKTTGYTVLSTDNGTWFIFNSASAVQALLPAVAPTAPWFVGFINIGAGLLTINPNARNLNGAGASTTLKTGQGTKVVTDGSNYFCAFQALSARTSIQKTTASLVNLAIESSVVALSKTILIVGITVDVPSRVRLYSTTAARDADVGRATTVPVAAGTENEVIMDVVLNNATGLTWIMSPAAWGSDGKVSPDGNIAYNITNMNGATNAVTVTWTFIALE